MAIASKYKINQRLISCGVVLLTSSFLLHFLFQEHDAMKKYMAYIVENGATSILYEKFINQNQSMTLMHAFSEQRLNAPLSAAQRSKLSAQIEAKGEVRGINLHAGAGNNILHGSLQSLNHDVASWVQDIPIMQKYDAEVAEQRHPYGLDAQRLIAGHKHNYYIDFTYQYVYFYHRLDVDDFQFSAWKLLEENPFHMSPAALRALASSDTVTTNIYQDHNTRQPVISLLTPVFSGGVLRGVVVVDFDKSTLNRMFYTLDRPRLWRYLALTINDQTNRLAIQVKQPEHRLFSYVEYRQSLSPDINVLLSVDFSYFILTSYQLLLPYIIGTLLLLYLVRNHFRRHLLLSKENITDSMTGLYNRKVLSADLENRLNHLVKRQIGITFIAIDLDGLKQINDTRGHKAGDTAITLLAAAILLSIRKSDYAVRLGGDEFCLILVNYTDENIAALMQRIIERLRQTDSHQWVKFSSGSYQMQDDDTLEHACHEADLCLYQDKQLRKNARRT
ncbi:diguanylate cyclase [Shimwellia pseudoproteus]|uniref:diguanylate cyclase DgcJ n=1 Tax=Shimwellia pseudoproteus TaxID=570012 RepID=UPI0018EBB3EC|nr:diguanylate cyclase [Shimwellia pseudoproteus]